MDAEYKKLLFKARRGMLELDLILKNFLETHYHELSQDLRQQFLDLMELQDPELLDLLINENYAEYPEYKNLTNIIIRIIDCK